MRIGFFGYNTGPLTTPDTAIEVARAAEDLGFESLWVAEHMVVPSPQAPPSPMAPDVHILDPMVSLTWAAAHTSRIRLGTGILLLPQRHPVQLAKEVASLDVLSKGRLEIGVGVGYLHQEFAAVGVPMERRGQRTDEYLGAMRALWESDAPSFDGEFVSFDGVDTQPRPVQSPLPIVMGGHSSPAYRRTAAFAQGWYGFRRSPEQAAGDIESIATACEKAGRDVGEIDISVTPDRRLDSEVIEQYEAVGVHRLLPAVAGDRDRVLATLEAISPGQR
jgi:probable F420-dependent oxidoreductase